MITADLNSTTKNSTTLKNHICRIITAETTSALVDKALDIITKDAPDHNLFNLCNSTTFEPHVVGIREVIRYPGKFTVAGWMIHKCDPQGEPKGEPYYHRETCIIIPAHKVA